MELARKIACQAVKELAGEDRIFFSEGEGDCGLFRGIFFRYLFELVAAAPDCTELEEVIRINARAVKEAMDEDGLIGKEWHLVNRGEIDLAQHLSGIMVLEWQKNLKRREAAHEKNTFDLQRTYRSPCGCGDGKRDAPKHYLPFELQKGFTDEFPGFIFNHNEAILYQWVKENETGSVQSDKKEGAEGSWHIIGGWYLQP